jgi:hypothetical protein
MIPTDGKNSSSKRRNNKKWLATEDLTRQPKEAKVLGAKYNANGQYGPAIEVKFSLEGESRFWTLRTTNPNWDIFVKQLGAEENDWVGNKFLINLEYDEYEEQYFPHVSFPAVNETAATSGKKAKAN